MKHTVRMLTAVSWSMFVTANHAAGLFLLVQFTRDHWWGGILGPICMVVIGVDIRTTWIRAFEWVEPDFWEVKYL